LEDPSNNDQRFRRNGLRHAVVPVIREHFDGFERALLRSVELSARDSGYLDSVAECAYVQVASTDDARVVLDRTWVRKQPLPIVSRVIRQIVTVLINGDLRELTFERVEAVRLAADGRTGAIIELPGGVRAHVERDRIVFTSVIATPVDGR
jgi:tRNA(Ile)-lysidine synthase